jgi:hypothetical protein
MSLARKLERECNINQRLISSYQQSFGMIEMLHADVLMRGLTYGGFESQDI